MPRDAVADRPVPMKPSSLPTSAAPAGFATRALLLLAAEGASVAFFLRTLRGARWLPAFIGRNEISPPGREQLATWVLGGAVVPVVVAALALGSAWKKGGFDAFAARAEGALQLARLLSVSLVLWAIPPMMSVAAWRDRDLAFLICAAALVVGFERALCCSLGAAEDLQLVRPLRDGALRAWSRVSARVRSAAPHAIVATMVASFVGYMGHYTWLQHLRRQTSGFDLGYFATFFWNTLHGRPFYCPITHPRAGSYLSIHFEPAVYLLAPLYALRPDASTLVILQSALLGLSAVPLYLIARRRLGSDWLGVVVAGAYLLYPPLHAPNFSDFHFLTVSAFFILWAAYFFFTERWLPFWSFVVMALMCREDVPFGGIGVGLALMLGGRRWRTGAALLAVSAGYLVAAKFVLMPRFGDASFVYIYEKLVAPGAVGFRGVIVTLVTNPLFVLATILLPEKIPFILHVFLPLAFLPLRVPRLWLLLFPGAFVTLLSTGYLPVVEIRFQYVTHFTPYVFIAAILALEQLGATLGRPARWAALGAVAFGTFLATHQFGALQQRNFKSGGGLVQFDFSSAHAENLRNLREIARTIPPDASVAATEHDAPHLAQREYLFTLKYEHQGADYLVYGYDDLDVGAARRIVIEELSAGRFGFHAERPNFVALRRGAPTDRNPELLLRLRP